MARKKVGSKIAVIDFETDPFLYGRIPKPFAAGFFDGITYQEFWGNDCADNLIRYLATIDEPLIIYAHNGGKFDFFYIFDYLENPLKIINGRIVEATIGKHVLRDSFAILPIPLSAYKKDDIDYSTFEVEKREENRADISHYLAKDCEYLYELVSQFVAQFGPKLTIGSAAIKQLTEIHPIAKQGQSHDEKFRPFYFGGRCEAIETGLITDSLNVFDVNSMYPSVMKNFKHPKGRFYASSSRGISKSGDAIGFGTRPYFARIIADNNGALPVRVKENGIRVLSFREKHGEFFTTGHEIRIALKHRLIKIHQVKELLIPAETVSFGEFVDKFFALRKAAKERGDKAHDIFYKLILNSSYGRFAIDPENFYDWHVGYLHDDMPEGFQPYERHGDILVCRKKATINRHSYHDVAVAASITGASRAVLMDALAGATRPVYCDTDSIIARSISAEIDPGKLGAWKHEGALDSIAIAGKKMYAGFLSGECEKMASKGVRLSPAEIVRVCKGDVINWKNDAPTFSLGGVNFIDRNVARRKKAG